MATSNVGNLAVVISGNAAPLSGVMSQTVRDVQNFTQTVNRISIAAPRQEAGGGSVFNLGAGMAAGIAGGATVKALDMVTGLVEKAGAAAIKGAADWERMSTAFEVMTGSAAKGSKLLREVEALAIATPFSSAGLASAGQGLMAMGVPSESLIPTMSRLGDIAAGNEEVFGRLAVVFGQVTSQGKLMGQDLLQFTNAGVGAKDFADTLGVSVEEFMKLKEAGQVGVGTVIETINRLTSGTGRFAEMNQKQLKTVHGQWNSLTETVAKSAKEVGLSVFKTLDVANNIGRLSDFLAPMERWGDALALPLRRGQSLLNDLWIAGKTAFGGLVASVKPFTDLIGGMNVTFEGSQEMFRQWLHRMVSGLGNLMDYGVRFAQGWSFSVGKPLAALTQATLWSIKQTANALADLSESKMFAIANPAVALALRGSGSELRGMAGRIDPGAFGAGTKSLFDALDEMGKPENMGRSAKWGDQFVQNWEAAQKAVAETARPKPDDVALIPKPQSPPAVEIAPMPRLGPPKEMVDFAEKLKNDFAERGPRGSLNELNMLNKAREMGLINEEVFNRGAFKLQESLSQSLNEGAEKFPAAMARGTQAAEAVISRAMGGARDPMRRVEDLLKQIADELRRSTLEEKEIGDALRGLGAQGVGF